MLSSSNKLLPEEDDDEIDILLFPFELPFLHPLRLLHNLSSSSSLKKLQSFLHFSHTHLQKISSSIGPC
ncbi:hypothetical protein Bca101_017139 [Brassica carinata]